jgi:hypothetical protein
MRAKIKMIARAARRFPASGSDYAVNAKQIFHCNDARSTGPGPGPGSEFVVRGVAEFLRKCAAPSMH